MTGPFLLSYGTAVALLVGLMHYAGVWNVLGNTRLLDLLIGGGVVALTDQDVGFVTGVADLEHYVRSQDPVDWELVLLAGGMFILLWLAKAYQFHALARFARADGSVSDHMRAYLLGHGANRVLPFGVGNLTAAAEVEKRGAPPATGMQVVFASRVFTVFEVIVFAAVGLYLSGVATWAGEIFWPLVILGCAWFLVRPRRGSGHGLGAFRTAAGRAVLALADEPGLLVRLCLLSIVAFLLADEGAYLIAQAFTSDNVVLNIDGGVILMGVVGGQLARLVTFTPGGLGQYEWGFASALYVGGVGFPEAATVALLVSFVRYAAGGLLMAAVLLRGGAPGVREPLARLAGAETRQAV